LADWRSERGWADSCARSGAESHHASRSASIASHFQQRHGETTAILIVIALAATIVDLLSQQLRKLVI
jgi:hypothetical protein